MPARAFAKPKIENRYGAFTDRGRAFQITDRATPTPWVNVISNARYGLVVSQNGGGFCWFDNSQLNVLTRWEMDLVRDDRGRFVYVADRDNGAIWSLAPAPCQPKYSRYSCTHAPGRTTFETEFDGIAAAWTLAVAPDDPVEIWSVRLENRSGRARRLRVA
jgi:cellobiose phosphorylase